MCSVIIVIIRIDSLLQKRLLDISLLMATQISNYSKDGLDHLKSIFIKTVFYVVVQE